MCKERWRTRDRLLEYDESIMPLRPHSAGLSMIYPWENVTLLTLEKQLYEIAKNTGFMGTEEDFLNNFGRYTSNNPIIYSIYVNFPKVGEYNKLYFDLEEKILYYWDNKYLPVNTTLIVNSILEGGGA